MIRSMDRDWVIPFAVGVVIAGVGFALGLLLDWPSEAFTVVEFVAASVAVLTRLSIHDYESDRTSEHR